MQMNTFIYFVYLIYNMKATNGEIRLIFENQEYNKILKIGFPTTDEIIRSIVKKHGAIGWGLE